MDISRCPAQCKIICVVGARPNFMKIAPIIEEINKQNTISAAEGAPGIDYILVHTGQHYDEKMSKYFFDDLGIPKPDINLEIGSSSHAVQTAEIMKKFELVCLREKPSHVLVVGDVNSTIACALVASKLRIKVIHVEAGLRSYDREMPEEINRVLTDAISDLLFLTEEGAQENLLKEGVAEERVHFVGNVMIDTLMNHRKKAAASDILVRLGLAADDQPSPKPYGLVTLHRPSNVDNKNIFHGILEALKEVSQQIPLIFPVHPRTVNRIREFGFENFFEWKTLDDSTPATQGAVINLINPQGYLDFLHLSASAQLALTDSGGVQEETTILGVPCVTIRENTERPVTITRGTNVLAGTRKDNVIKAAMERLQSAQDMEHVDPPPLWDGKAAERIVKILVTDCQAPGLGE